MHMKNTSILLSVFIGALSHLVAAEKPNPSKVPPQPITLSTDFSDINPDVINLGPYKTQWRMEDGVLKSVGNLDRSCEFSVVGDPGWQDYEVELKVKRIEVAQEKDQHFGITVRRDGEDSFGKATSYLRFYCRGDSVIFLEVADGKEVRHKKLGELPAVMEVGGNAPWVTFRIVVKDNQAEVYADGTLVGEVNDIVPQSGPIVFTAVNLNLWVDDLKVTVTR